MRQTELDFVGTDTLASVWAFQVEHTPDAPFLVFEQAPDDVQTLTYRQMDDRAERAAQVLRANGVGIGDRFVIHLANCVEFYDLWLGAAKSGAVMVPTNPLSSADEMAYVFEHSGGRFTVTSPDLVDVVRAAQKQLPDGGESSRVLITGGGVPPGECYDTALAAAPDAPVQAAQDPSAVVGVLYTSGTTSRPKGVLVTNANYLYAGRYTAEYLRLRPEDRQLVVLPLFHGNAQYYSTMSALVTGASVALAPRFTASRWSEQATKLGATAASLFAAPIRMILRARASEYDRAHRIRVALFAQNVNDDQAVEFERRFELRLTQLWGMTETIVPTVINPLHGQRRHNTIGRPGVGIRIRIVGEDGADVAPGEVGELLVGGVPGRTLMLGYLDNPAATAEALADGWLRSGDNVRADADGYLHFVDRGKDVIKRAGENVASGEVERVINEHPAVFESAAIGVPDEMRDEAIKMFVVLHENAGATEEELIVWAAARLAKFKVPSHVEFIETLPRTSVGKVQKHVLRKRENPGS
ncbi:MAG TPA: AMP-binding protein [Sporichthyaceae bacterium]|nr:AMP-binding protein [Sporichthyaceae bacterium]